MKELNGFFLLDKGMNVSSNSALYPIKKLLPRKYKVGHTGTLDPNATGLLVVAIGRATKFINYIKCHKKSYRAGIRFGEKTDTGDIWGEVLSSDYDSAISENDFLKASEAFVGLIKQVPPMYSAIKQNGRPLYELARKGIEVERKAREVEICSIDLVSFDYPNAEIEVSCSLGTYIRTLIEDIAESAGGLATMSSLRRLNSDGFCVEDAITERDIRSFETLSEKLISIEEAFKDLDIIKLESDIANKLKNGIKIDLEFYLSEGSGSNMYRVYSENEFVALAERDAAGLSIKKWL